MKKLFNLITRLFYHGDYELIGSPAKKSMDSFAVQAIFGTACMIFISGTFISGFLIRLDAPDILVNYMALIPSMCGIILFLFSPLAQRIVHPKKVGILINCMAKFFLVTIMYVPYVFPKPIVLPVAVLFIILGYSLNAFNNQIINNWFVQSIPEGIRGRYYSYRQIVAMIISATLPLLAGALVDSFDDKLKAFAITSLVAVVLALIEVSAFARIPDCTLVPITEKLSILDTVRIPLRNRRFVKFLCYMGAFYFVLYLSGGMKQTYMLKYMNLSYTFVNGMTVLSSVLQAVFFYSLWGRVNDRLGSRFTMTTAVWLYALDAFFWFFAGNTTLAYIFIPMGHIMGAIQGPAFTVGSFNYQYSIYPEQGRPMYSAFYTSFIGLVLIISPTCGEFVKSLIERSAIMEVLPFGGFRLMYLASAVLILTVQLVFITRERKKNPGSVSLDRGSYRYIFNTLFHKV